MGGFFGTVSMKDCVTDLFYGTDYNSHLGTKRGGMATYDKDKGFIRSIHSLESAYFRSKFEDELPKFSGHAGIGIISDTDSQPLVINSHLGKFAIVTVAKINNIEELEKVKLDKSASKLKIIEQTIEMLRADKENDRKAYIDQLIEEAINESKMVLNDDINKNEFKNYLRIALEKISSLLIQGMEIVPAIKAKPVIKQLSQKATQNIEEKRKLVIGCDNLKYLTLLNPTISAKDIPSDTLEMN